VGIVDQYKRADTRAASPDADLRGLEWSDGWVMPWPGPTTGRARPRLGAGPGPAGVARRGTGRTAPGRGSRPGRPAGPLRRRVGGDLPGCARGGVRDGL